MYATHSLPHFMSTRFNAEYSMPWSLEKNLFCELSDVVLPLFFEKFPQCDVTLRLNVAVLVLSVI